MNPVSSKSWSGMTCRVFGSMSRNGMPTASVDRMHGPKVKRKLLKRDQKSMAKRARFAGEAAAKRWRPGARSVEREALKHRRESARRLLHTAHRLQQFFERRARGRRMHGQRGEHAFAGRVAHRHRD